MFSWGKKRVKDRCLVGKRVKYRCLVGEKSKRSMFSWGTA